MSSKHFAFILAPIPGSTYFVGVQTPLGSASPPILEIPASSNLFETVNRFMAHEGWDASCTGRVLGIGKVNGNIVWVVECAVRGAHSMAQSMQIDGNRIVDCDKALLCMNRVFDNDWLLNN